MSDRPGFTHQRERHGVIGPFGGRQLAVVFVLVVVTVIVLVAVTTPLGTVGGTPDVVDPRATAFVIKEAPAEGLRPGDLAPEFEVTLEEGDIYSLNDLDGNPIRLADLRGKGVWINFWATWCPPCQSEVPILRDLSERYADQGLVVVAISVQETQPSDVQAYADKYQLDYTIGFDGSGLIFDLYKSNALPTHFFVRPDGIIRAVEARPLTEEQAIPLVESILPAS
ncbi:MAG: TlpA disulfide reductase family protein [Candidatus Limnocylindrales bacterium]